MKALIVVVMGGIGHVLGGLVAGIVLGLAETHGALCCSIPASSPSSTSPFSRSCCCGARKACSAAAPGPTSARSASPAARRSAAGGSWRHCCSRARLCRRLLAFAPGQHPDLRGARDRLGASSPAPRATFRWRLPPSSASAPIAVAVLAPDYSYGLALAASAGRRQSCCPPSSGLATLRLSGMYFVIFTFGLAALVREIVSWWEFNVAQKAGRHLFLSITTTHIYYQLLALVRGHHRAVADPRHAAAWALP